MSIIIMKRGNLPQMPEKQVLCQDGELKLRCGGCGTTRFEVVVIPRPERGDARITAVACGKCCKILKTEDGFIGSSRTEIDNGNRKDG